MTSTSALSHQETFNNMQTYEKFSSLEKKTIRGFGVRGKKFVLSQTNDSLLSRIWFSFLKFFRVIKVNPSAVDKFLKMNTTHLALDDYKKWSDTENKLLPSQITALKADNAAKDADLKAKDSALEKEKKKAAKLESDYKNSHKHSKEKGEKIAKLTTELAEARHYRNKLESVISHIKHNFNFNDIDQYIQEKKIEVISAANHAVEDVKSAAHTAKEKGAAVAGNVVNHGKNAANIALGAGVIAADEVTSRTKKVAKTGEKVVTASVTAGIAAAKTDDELKAS